MLYCSPSFLRGMRLCRLNRREKNRETDRNMCRRQTIKCGMSKAAKSRAHSPVEESPWWWAECQPFGTAFALPQSQCRPSGWWGSSISVRYVALITTVHWWSACLFARALPAWKTSCRDLNLGIYYKTRLLLSTFQQKKTKTVHRGATNYIISCLLQINSD